MGDDQTHLDHRHAADKSPAGPASPSTILHQPLTIPLLPFVIRHLSFQPRPAEYSMSNRNRGAPNPFYAILIVVSTAFAITVFGYLIGPYMQQRALANPESARTGGRAFALWFDRHGVQALSAEFVVMVIASILAVATDQWFSPKKPSRHQKDLD
jgi:hypothetical protein